METLRVLITDDEPGMRLGVNRILSKFTIEVPDIDARAASRSTRPTAAKRRSRIMPEHAGRHPDPRPQDARHQRSGCAGATAESAAKS